MLTSKAQQREGRFLADGFALVRNATWLNSSE